jgi:RHS repeat-associated protein
LLPERTVEGVVYRNGFQGQERDDEVKGEGNSVNYSYRMHDPRVGRFFAVDPLSTEFPWNSPYAFSENVLISAVELEGLEKFYLHTYSFAPFDSFGGGFHGDGSNRKFNDKIDYVMPGSKSTNYRIGAKIKVDMTPTADKVTYDQDINAFGSYSYNSGDGEKIDGPGACYSQGYCEKISNTTVFPIDGFLMSWAGYFHNYGGNCDAPSPAAITPNIDVYLDLNLGLSYGPNAEGYVLDVRGDLTGDRFPSNEVFITDESGNKVMLGVSGPDTWGPYFELVTTVFTEEQMSNFQIQITLDENYRFTGVRLGGRTYNLVEWNNMFKALSPTESSTNTTINSEDGTFETDE